MNLIGAKPSNTTRQEHVENIEEVFKKHASWLTERAHRELIRHLLPDLEADDVVMEVFLRLLNGEVSELATLEPRHQRALLRSVMRRTLVDQARNRFAAKRGGNLNLVSMRNLDAFAKENTLTVSSPEIILALDEALARLAVVDARVHRVVQLRYFTGLTDEETAEVLNISSRTVKREYATALAWLRAELG